MLRAAILILAALPLRAQTPEAIRAEGRAAFQRAQADPVAQARAGEEPETAPPPRLARPAAADGPEAVLELERSFRGKKNPAYKPCEHGDAPHAPVRRRREDEAYPDARPLPFTGTANITAMSKDLWKRADVEKDFAKNKGEGQEAILVIVKTELCHLNEHRICAAATAALEKRATPALAKFRVYGAWVRGNPANQGAETRRWEDELIEAYGFRQGPGAKIIVLIPGVGRPFESSAVDLGLTVDELEKNKGKAPKLEQFLNDALETGRALRR